MNYLFDLLQGAGIAAAIGLRPFLPVLLVGLLASANIGLDYDGTAFAFLEAPIFLGVVGGAAVATIGGGKVMRTDRAVLALGVVGVVLAALSASGSLDDRSDVWWPGIPVGAACAVLAFLVARSLLTRVRARLDEETAGALPVYAEVAAVVLAGLSVLFPPLALVGLGLLLWLLIGSRRREGEKYAGLRILR